MEYEDHNVTEPLEQLLLDDEASKTPQQIQTLLNKIELAGAPSPPAIDALLELLDVKTQNEGCKLILRCLGNRLAQPDNGNQILSHDQATKLFTKITAIVGIVRKRISSDDADFEKIVSDASLVAAGLKLLHIFLRACFPSGASPNLRLDNASLTDLVETLLGCAHCRSRMPSRSGATRPTLSSSVPNIKVGSDTETLLSTDYGSDRTNANPDGEIFVRKRISSVQRTVRQNAITCLAALQDIVPSALFSTWPLLLESEDLTPSRGALGNFSSPRPASGTTIRQRRSLLYVIRDDPVLSLRLSACQLVATLFKTAQEKGFLASGISEPRTSGLRPAFTSLGSRMATLISDTRQLLARLLESSASAIDTRPIPDSRRRDQGVASCIPHIPLPLTEAILRLTRTLVTATSSAKFIRSHGDVLREPVMRLSSHSDPSIAISAFNVLSILTPSSKAPTPGVDQQMSIQSLLDKLSDQSLDKDIIIKAWSALSSFVQNDRSVISAQQERILLDQVERDLSNDDQAVRQGCITFTTAVIDEMKSVQLVQSYQRIIDKGSQDTSSLVRADVTQILHRGILLELNARNHFDKETTQPDENLHLSTAIDRLLVDEEAAVRAGAIRAIGVLVTGGSRESEDRAVEPGQDHLDIIVPLSLKALRLDSAESPLNDAALLVRLRSSWALGNLCQMTCHSGRFYLEDSKLKRISDHVLRLVKDDERVALNGLRCAGLLLSNCSLDVVPSLDLLEAILNGINTSKNPKSKWNAVNALSTCLHNQAFQRWIKDQDMCEKVITTLSFQLHCKTFKVKLACTSGILALHSDGIPAKTIIRLRKDISLALSNIDSELNAATFSQVQLHGQSIKTALMNVQNHVEHFHH
ncbi:unnamed protein product [Sympodiomycopsis kandeliae]